MRHAALAQLSEFVAQTALDERASLDDATVQEDGADQRFVSAGEVRRPLAAAGRVLTTPKLEVFAEVEARGGEVTEPEANGASADRVAGRMRNRRSSTRPLRFRGSNRLRPSGLHPVRVRPSDVNPHGRQAVAIIGSAICGVKIFRRGVAIA